MSTTLIDIPAETPQLLEDVSVHEKDLSEEAEKRFQFHGKIMDGFERHRQNILLDVNLTREGRHILFSNIHRLHQTCKIVLNYVAKNDGLLKQSLPTTGPLVICGLPRTDTTLLYNLLACDPDCRAPLFSEMFGQAVPPIGRFSMNEQTTRNRSEYLAEHKEKEISASHPVYAIDEDLHILQHASLFALYALVNADNQDGPHTWFHEATNKDFAYDYHKIFLQMLNSVDPPTSHWLLKSHWHIFFMSTFLRHYPQALLIMTHRSLDEVFPSYCRLIWG